MCHQQVDSVATQAQPSQDALQTAAAQSKGQPALLLLTLLLLALLLFTLLLFALLLFAHLGSQP